MGYAYKVQIGLRKGFEVNFYRNVAVVLPLEAVCKLEAIDVKGFFFNNFCAYRHCLSCRLDKETVDSRRGVWSAVDNMLKNNMLHFMLIDDR